MSDERRVVQAEGEEQVEGFLISDEELAELMELPAVVLTERIAKARSDMEHYLCTLDAYGNGPHLEEESRQVVREAQAGYRHARARWIKLRGVEKYRDSSPR